MRRFFSKIIRPDMILKSFLLAAPILSATMAVISPYNAHPDELQHFEAAKYYKDHILPPEIGDPSVAASYSVWGISYLNYQWVEYFLAGKFMFVSSPFVLNDL